MAKWVTLFERFESFHLFKDVGQIPYHVKKLSDVDVEVWRKSFNSDENDYPFRIVNIESSRKGNAISFSIFKKIISNSKEINYLNLFHLRRNSLFYAVVYKLFNKNGKVFIKCDFSNDSWTHKSYRIKKVLIKLLCRLDFINVLLIEHWDIYCLFKNMGVDCIYSPNGVSEAFYLNNTEVKKTTTPNLIFVGKCGDVRKNAEELVCALLSIGDRIEWEVSFVGSETDEFRKWFDDKSKGYDSKIIQRFNFLGFLSDPKKMIDLYQRSHIFVMTSLKEGYPLSLSEACWCGCYPILSKGSGGRDLGKLGLATIYDTKDDLKLNLFECMENLEETIEKGRKVKTHVEKFNDWRIILSRLGVLN